MLGGKKCNVSTFQVGVIRAKDKKVTQKGLLEATPNSLVFTDDATQRRTSWPLKSLRKFEATSNKVFVVEALDDLENLSVFLFSTSKAKQIQNLVLHHMSTMIHSEQPYLQSTTRSATPPSVSQTTPIIADDITPHWQLNTRSSMESSSSCSTISPTHSRTSSTPRDIFEVEKIIEDPSKKIVFGILEVVENEVIFVDGGLVEGRGGGKRFAWPIKCLRRFGFDGNIFTLEVGRRAPGGEGLHNFKTSRPAELNAAVKSASAGSRGGSGPPSPYTVETSSKLHSQHFSFTPPMQRAPLPPHPPQIPLPPLPSQPSLPLPPLPSQTPLPLPPPSQPPLPPPPSQPPLPLPPPSQPPLPLPPSSPQSSHHRPSNHLPNQRPCHERKAKTKNFNQGRSPTFNRSDSLIRRAYSACDLRKNVFEVRNISDDKTEVGKGTVEVTSTDLIYIDSRTDEKWKWPFKFLRKYGYEDNIFSFEAGRRCPGGQGLYAFASEQANEIHETIVESIRGSRGCKHEEAPARASVTPENVGAASRFSLVDGQAVPPVVKLATKNHYNIETSPNLTMRTSGQPFQSPSHNQTASYPVPITTPNSALPNKSVSSSSSERESSVTPPNSARVVNIDPSLSTAKTSPNSTVAPQSQLLNPFVELVKPVMELVKPVMEPAKLIPISREHLYDIIPHGKDTDSRRSHDQRKVSASTDDTKVALRKQSSDRKKRSNSAASPSEKELKNRNSKSDLKSNRRQSQNSPEVHDATTVSGDVVAKDTPQKPRSKILSRLIGKRSMPKKKGRRAEGDLIDSSPSRDEDEVLEEGGRSMYVNVGRLMKTPHSASCDDLLSSCNLSDSHSTTPSAVPMPQLRHSQTPPTTRRQMEDGNRLNLDNSVPLSSTPAIIYQNLNEMKTRANRSHSHPVQAPPTLIDTPPNSSIDQSHLYSNVALMNDIQPSQNVTTYAEVEIIQTPFASGDSQSPSPSTGTPKRTSPFIKPKLLPQTSPSSNRHRSRSMFPSVPPASDSSSRIRSQSDLISDNMGATPELSLNEIAMGLAVVEENEPVSYATLNHIAGHALAQIKNDHLQVRNFDELLRRHDIRELEMERKKGTHVVT